MPRLEAEDTRTPVHPRPGDGAHAPGMVRCQQHLAVNPRIVHQDGLVIHLTGVAFFGARMGGIGDLDAQRLLGMMAEAAILDTDHLAPDRPLRVGKDGMVQEDDALLRRSPVKRNAGDDESLRPQRLGR
ncbi:MAG: hypothetical protein F4191_05775 [Rhodothermaceae bacterium]|nr:hypothetical protein [Rhodothermaceae bacterium]